MNLGISSRPPCMADAEERPRAVVTVRVGGKAIPFVSIDRSTRCDLGLVEDLLRLQLTAARLGVEVGITEVRSDLRELFELVGLADRLAP
jgi:ABC-type transporter Mla MlaB component